MKREKFSFLVSLCKQSVDVLITRAYCGVSTLFHVLMRDQQQSVDNPRLLRRINTSTLLLRGNRKPNFFHVHKALTEAL